MDCNNYWPFETTPQPQTQKGLLIPIEPSFLHGRVFKTDEQKGNLVQWASGLLLWPRPRNRSDDPARDRTRDCVRATRYRGRTIEHTTYIR